MLKKAMPDFFYFYGHLRYRIFVLLVTSILVGLMDGLGLAMFVPLLELVADPASSPSAEKLGNLSFLVEGLSKLGLTLTLSVVLTTMFVFFVIKGIATFYERYMRVIYQQYFIAKIRLNLIQSFAAYNYTAFVKADAGTIQNTMSGEVERVVQAFRAYSTLLQQAVMIGTYSGLAFLANPEFAVLVVLGGVLSHFLFSALYRRTKVLSSELVQRNHTFQGFIIQSVAFFKYLKATATMGKYAQFLRQRVMDIEETNRKMGILNSMMLGVREPMTIGVVVAIILIQVNVLGGSLSTVILSLLFFYRALTSLNNLQTAYNQFLGYSGSMANMDAFSKQLSVSPTPSGTERFTGFERNLVLKDIWFSYAPDCAILQEVNLEIKKNESIAFVGESGSGKTTLLNIFSGLIQPSQGTFSIDGKSISDLDIHSFQSRIGYITQDPVIFDDTVFNNVTFWDKRTPDNLSKFYSALEKATILEFLQGLANKENTRLGINGVSLSGGQKQRISIARELYKEVDFLFLDEATSALDSETEKTIQQSLDKLKGRFTIITIAHRLSTIRNVDRVVLLGNGKVQQIGTYQEVLAGSSLFKRMVALQTV